MLQVVRTSAPVLPTLALITNVPVVAEQDVATLAAFQAARSEATTPDEYAEWLAASGQTRRAGRPKTNLYVACEAAYIVDVECKPMFIAATKDDAEPPSVASERGYVRPDAWLTQEGGSWTYKRVGNDSELVPDRLVGWRLRSAQMERVRDEGRSALARLGAWPWALEQDGKIAPGGRRWWWQQERYWDALAAWAAAE